MSPKLFEYKGISLTLFPEDHNPLHVHALYNEYEMKVEFETENEKIVGIKYKSVKGRNKFPSGKLNDLKKLIEAKKYEIIALNVKINVYHSRIKVEKINKL